MGMRTKTHDDLLPQEALLIENYLACNCNGAEAAKRAGYSATSREGLAATASRVLARARVKKALEEKRKAIAMGATEVIQRHSEFARASLEDVLDVAAYPELAHAAANGKLHLIREFTITTRTIPTKQGPLIERQVNFKIHDAKDAQKTLMKYHGLLTDVIAVKDLPKTEDELVASVMKEVARVTGEAPSAKKVKA